MEEEIVDEGGETVLVRYGRPLELGLHYMVTAAADDLADEHEILALGLRGFLDHAKITGDQLVGDSFFKGDAVRVTHYDAFSMETAQQVFSALPPSIRFSFAYRLEPLP